MKDTCPEIALNQGQSDPAEAEVDTHRVEGLATIAANPGKISFPSAKIPSLLMRCFCSHMSRDCPGAAQ